MWALAAGSAPAWAALAVATSRRAGALVATLLSRRQRLRDAGVPRRSIVAGLLLAVVGFFLVPVVGFFIGFPLGVNLAERRRLGRPAAAWRSTREALRATGLTIVIELSAAVPAAGAWLAAVLI